MSTIYNLLKYITIIICLYRIEWFRLLDTIDLHRVHQEQDYNKKVSSRWNNLNANFIAYLPLLADCINPLVYNEMLSLCINPQESNVFISGYSVPLNTGEEQKIGGYYCRDRVITGCAIRQMPLDEQKAMATDGSIGRLPWFPLNYRGSYAQEDAKQLATSVSELTGETTSKRLGNLAQSLIHNAMIPVLEVVSIVAFLIITGLIIHYLFGLVILTEHPSPPSIPDTTTVSSSQMTSENKSPFQGIFGCIRDHWGGQNLQQPVMTPPRQGPSEQNFKGRNSGKYYFRLSETKNVFTTRIWPWLQVESFKAMFEDKDIQNMNIKKTGSNFKFSTREMTDHNDIVYEIFLSDDKDQKIWIGTVKKEVFDQMDKGAQHTSAGIKLKK